MSGCKPKTFRVLPFSNLGASCTAFFSFTWVFWGFSCLSWTILLVLFGAFWLFLNLGLFLSHFPLSYLKGFRFWWEFLSNFEPWSLECFLGWLPSLLFLLIYLKENVRRASSCSEVFAFSCLLRSSHQDWRPSFWIIKKIVHWKISNNN